MSIWPFNRKAKQEQARRNLEREQRQQSQFQINMALALVEENFSGQAKAERLMKVAMAQSAHNRKYGMAGPMDIDLDENPLAPCEQDLLDRLEVEFPVLAEGEE